MRQLLPVRRLNPRPQTAEQNLFLFVFFLTSNRSVTLQLGDGGEIKAESFLFTLVPRLSLLLNVLYNQVHFAAVTSGPTVFLTRGSRLKAVWRERHTKGRITRFFLPTGTFEGTSIFTAGGLKSDPG